MQDREWFVLRNSRVQGPYSNNEVQRYLLLGRISSVDRFSTDGHSWHSLASFPELIPEPLASIDTDDGWEAYLKVKNQVDERHPASEGISGPGTDRRGAAENPGLEAFRSEWMELLGQLQPKPDPPASRVIPLSMLLGMVAVIFVLLLLIQP